MKNKHFNRYYLLSCIGVLIASYYPLSMGVRVIADMIIDGTVLKENYPKYIIPYTPICIAIIIGVLLMPLCIKLLKRFALAGGASIATGMFFALELLFEQKVVVSTAETVTKLEEWQMFMCYIPPEGWGETVTAYKTQTAVDILMGDYNPAFKLHFYIISVVLKQKPQRFIPHFRDPQGVAGRVVSDAVGKVGADVLETQNVHDQLRQVVRLLRNGVGVRRQFRQSLHVGHHCGLFTKRPCAGARGRHDRIPFAIQNRLECLYVVLDQRDRFGVVARVDVHLATASLGLRKVNLVS